MSSSKRETLLRFGACGVGLLLLAVVALAVPEARSWPGALALIAAAAAVAYLSLVHRGSPRVVALMYHSVNDRPDQFPVSHLVRHPRSFEAHMRMLHRAGYRTIDLDTLAAYRAGRAEVPRRSLVITFDDGYLDNHVFAAPILQKYGFTGTVYVTTDFIEPHDDVRPTLADAWRGDVAEAELPRWGHLSRGELRHLDAQGVLDVQSHARTHTWYFSGPEVVGTYEGPQPFPWKTPPWLEWNHDRSCKPTWINDMPASVPPGSPILVSSKSLGTARRYLPDEEAYEKAAAAETMPATVEGRFETDEEAEARLRDELAGAKEILEALLDRPVPHMAWPGGGKCDEAIAIARELYVSSTAGLGWNDRHGDPFWVYRIGMGDEPESERDRRLELWRLRADVRRASGNFAWYAVTWTLGVLARIGVGPRW